jgi:hypothetical protein
VNHPSILASTDCINPNSPKHETTQIYTCWCSPFPYLSKSRTTKIILRGGWQNPAKRIRIQLVDATGCCDTTLACNQDFPRFSVSATWEVFKTHLGFMPRKDRQLLLAHGRVRTKGEGHSVGSTVDQRSVLGAAVHTSD